MTVARYRIVDAAGDTVAELRAGPVGSGSALRQAVEAANDCGGKVEYVDRDDQVTLVHAAARAAVGAAPA